MPIKTGNLINISEITHEFITNVYNPIVANCYDNTNIPIDQENSSSPQYQMIDINHLGNLANNKKIIQNYLNNIGISGSVINAHTLAQFMSLALQVLRKVGTWSYVRTYNNNGQKIIRFSASGKAIFSDAFVSSIGIKINDIGIISGTGLVSGQIISANTITDYYTILLTKWNSMIKPSDSLTVDTCHSDCHSNCHRDCHRDCNCYK